MIRTGRIVLVWPVGKENLKATATVAIISESQRSIAVGFVDSPPFRWDPGLGIHPDHGLLLFASRTTDNVPDGPWTEMMSEGLYEIKEIANDQAAA